MNTCVECEKPAHWFLWRGKAYCPNHMAAQYDRDAKERSDG